MKNKARKLTLCRHSPYRDENYPYVLLKAKWFRDFGFSPGDQVTFSNPKLHALLITVQKTAAEADKERQAKVQRQVKLRRCPS